jgi:hypothetical protein
MVMSKLSLENEMRALDQKDREFYDSLDESERKKFSLYLMMRYSANVSGSPELEQWYLLAHNERVNKNYYDLKHHPKLQWLVCTTVSPGMGNKRHYWLAPKRGEFESRTLRFIEQLYPGYSDQEIELVARINTVDQLRDYARSLGWTEEQIKKEL